MSYHLESSLVVVLLLGILRGGLKPAQYHDIEKEAIGLLRFTAYYLLKTAGLFTKVLR